VTSEPPRLAWHGRHLPRKFHVQDTRSESKPKPPRSARLQQQSFRFIQIYSFSKNTNQLVKTSQTDGLSCNDLPWLRKEKEGFMAENESWSGKFHADACRSKAFFPWRPPRSGAGPLGVEAQAAEASGPVRCSPGSPTPPNPLVPSSLSPSPAGRSPSRCAGGPAGRARTRTDQPELPLRASGLRCPF